MTDIAAVFSAKPSGPYDKGLVVKVLQVGEEITYKGKDGSSKLVLIAAISDGKEVIKLVCYNADAFKHIKVCFTFIVIPLIYFLGFRIWSWKKYPKQTFIVHLLVKQQN
jgi:hypothetical protein